MTENNSLRRCCFEGVADPICCMEVTFANGDRIRPELLSGTDVEKNFVELSCTCADFALLRLRLVDLLVLFSAKGIFGRLVFEYNMTALFPPYCFNMTALWLLLLWVDFVVGFELGDELTRLDKGKSHPCSLCTGGELARASESDDSQKRAGGWLAM